MAETLIGVLDYDDWVADPVVRINAGPGFLLLLYKNPDTSDRKAARAARDLAKHGLALKENDAVVATGRKTVIGPWSRVAFVLEDDKALRRLATP